MAPATIRPREPCGSSRVSSPRNLLVPAKDPRAQMGFIIMEPEDTPPMSGSNSICVATVLLDAGILPMQEPETHFTLEAPGGLVAVTAECRNGKAERISIENVPSFADRLDAPLEVAGFGTLKVDIAYGGDSFVIVDAGGARFRDRARRSARSRRNRHAHHRRRQRAARLLPPRERSGWDHISFCQFAGPSKREGNELQARTPCVIRPGKIDRSPTGTGCSARMAVLSARGLMGRATSIAPAPSSAPSSSAASPARPRSAAGRRSSRLFPAGPGLPASASICSTRPIRGLRATGSRTLGRVLGRQFERFARFARLG